MPYITASSRTKLDRIIEDLVDAIATEAETPDIASGILNYAITRLLTGTFENLDDIRKYSHIALVTGVLENVKQEYYRRFAAPFEDKKRDLNGDIPEYEQ